FYRLQMVPDRFAIGVGETVTNGFPGVGAGNIESPGAQDIYTFTVAAGQAVYFDSQAWEDYTLEWRLLDPAGAQVFVRCLGCGSPGVLILTNAGPYTIIVGSRSAATGTYQFKLWNVAAPQQFSIAVGDTVSN